LLLASDSLLGETNGEKVLKTALTYPIKQVLENIGMSADGIITKILATGGTYDARKKVYTLDAIGGGVIDPVKVVKSSFLNAISIAKELIKAGGIISYVKQPELDDQNHSIDE
jgi:chaperonin GroEL